MVFWGRAVSMILKISWSVASSSRNAPPSVDVSGWIMASSRERVVDDFVRRGPLACESGWCGIAVTELISLKCQAMQAAMETARSNSTCAVAARSCADGGGWFPRARRRRRCRSWRRTDERIEDQHHAALIFAREFADHQVAGAGSDFPIHECGRCRWADIRAGNAVRGRVRENSWPFRRSAAAGLRRIGRSARRCG